MAVRRSTRSSPCTRDSSDGHSLLELLLALSVVLVITGAALSIALSANAQRVTDENRTAINQNLRAALDLIGIEVRQAGQRLPGDFPAIEIVDGADGAPDTLILRRNLVDEVLPLCENLEAKTYDSEVSVADSDPAAPPGCAPLADDDGNGWPDNLDVWRDYRDESGGQVWAYVFSPVTGNGEWFLFDDDGDAQSIGNGNDHPWAYAYGAAEQCRIYILEERRYALREGLLGYQPGVGDEREVRISAGITDFQARARLDDGSVLDRLDSDTRWTRLSAIELSITGQAEFDGKTMTRTVNARFFPRNVLSN